ncbi:multi-sensor hybrid histidine kinase [Solidesulfovibrio carbinoliphilus subsp. oakridgensis]|uniref:histidine kinase n=1 Tax=Solidesulfovibrio carbinoliphilus subsp. oakridgensis TaxID=694327 RepID=G7Q4W4_9BACT|nr:ATP-binding protein [Solidesulfovibrio carbinoliphilus]EHJ47891.1 multi-sensor hybrid histidine kinase [Solidesulfovibrio carbinoliphilus subsp. oakridgensis]
MTATPTTLPVPVANRRVAVAAGLATTCLLAALLGLLAGWHQEHHWWVWEVWELRIFCLTALVVAGLPGLLVGLLVDRQHKLRLALSRREEEVGTARADLAWTNRALVALGAVNHELIRATDRTGFLVRVCQALVEKSGYGLVWVGMAEPGPDKRVRIEARAGENAAWLETLGARYDDTPKGRGPTGTAIREGRMVLVSRFQDENFFQLWPGRPSSLEHYTTALSFPLRIDGRVIGALSIYERRQRDFGPEELALLTQMADDVSHGLQFLHLKASRERVTTMLRQALRASSAMVRTTRELVAGEADLPAIAAMILKQAMALTASPLGAVGVVEGRTGRLDWLTVCGPTGPLAPALAEECDYYPDDSGHFSGPFAATLNAGESLRHNAPVSLDAVGPCFPNRAQVHRFLAVPLRRTATGPGGLLLLADAKAPYSDRDARTLQRMAVLFDMGAARLRVETELVAARRQAEAASEAKTQFLANVSHELRTPINGILGMAQLAILEGAVGRDAEYWQTVRDATDRLVAIVDNLLELASVESGSLSPLLREFSLRRLLESLRGAFSVRAGLAGLTLGLDITPGLPDRLLGDPFRLRQILGNLLDNAIRFTPSGGVSMQIRPFDPRTAGGPQRVFVAGDFNGISLVFTVTDTGIGIPKDKQAAIFESFTLGEDHLTKRFGGTGMGLSIARRLAELLGGSIWVESRPGFGSTFHLTVPMWPVSDEAGPALASALPADLPPLRFLVVEDEAVNRLALARSLRKLGHEVLEAGNGEEALRQLSMERVDVVIMDVQMPVMDGLAAVAHIRNGEVPGTNRRLPVVALTAYALEGDRKRFLAAGMDEFVTKPCDMDQLLRAVAKVVGKVGG